MNISLDTLRKDRYAKITRVNGFELAFQGLMEALKVGFDQVKLNCVVLRRVNDDELLDFVRLAELYPLEVRFIEFMPFASNGWSDDKMVTYSEMLSSIRQRYHELIELNSKPGNVTKLFGSTKMVGTIGFITSMSDNFCSGCNRIRITADGNLKVCLFGREETSIRDLIRFGATDFEVVQAVRSSLYKKWKQHTGELVGHISHILHMSRVSN